MRDTAKSLRMMADDSDADFPNSADGSVMREAADEIEKLRAALTDLVARVELCGKESAGIFQIAALHGCPYNGPNWTKELEAALAALSQ